MPRTKQPLCAGFVSSLKNLIENAQNSEGRTITQIAEGIGITRQSLNQYLSGKSEPNFTTLISIAEYFNVSLDFLLGRTNIKSADPELSAIAEYLGLSDTCCEYLHERLESVKSAYTDADTLSDFILYHDAALKFCCHADDYVYNLHCASETLAEAWGYSSFLFPTDSNSKSNMVSEYEIHCIYEKAQQLYEQAMFQRFHAQEICNDFVKNRGKDELQQFKNRLDDVYNHLYGKDGALKKYRADKPDTDYL